MKEDIVGNNVILAVIPEETTCGAALGLVIVTEKEPVAVSVDGFFTCPQLIVIFVPKSKTALF